MEKFSFRKELEETWSEFSSLLVRFTPDVLKKLYRNRPLFIASVFIVLLLEVAVAYFLYDYFLSE